MYSWQSVHLCYNNYSRMKQAFVGELQHVLSTNEIYNVYYYFSREQ